MSSKIKKESYEIVGYLPIFLIYFEFCNATYAIIIELLHHDPCSYKTDNN